MKSKVVVSSVQLLPACWSGGNLLLLRLIEFVAVSIGNVPLLLLQNLRWRLLEAPLSEWLSVLAVNVGACGAAVGELRRLRTGQVDRNWARALWARASCWLAACLSCCANWFSRVRVCSCARCGVASREHNGTAESGGGVHTHLARCSLHRTAPTWSSPPSASSRRREWPG